MPDTGAPWNIPYVENADLVRDWPADSLLVANAVAAGLTAAGNPGIGSNVVQALKTDTFSTASTTFVDVTGLSVTITPTSNTAKLLCMYQYQAGNVTVPRGHAMIVTDGSNNVLIEGDASSDRTQAVTGTTHFTDTATVYTYGATFLLAPASTAALTIKLRVKNGSGGGTVTINRSGGNADNADSVLSVSHLTVIEVAA